MSVFIDEFDVAGSIHESTLEEDLRLDRMNLNEEFSTHAQKFAFYSTAYELCLDQERRVKAKLSQAYAKLDQQARAKLVANGIRVVEKKVENMVITTPDYIEIQEELFEVQRMVGVLKAARDAMIHKKEAMVSLGANMRQEMNADPMLLQEAYRNQNHKK